MGHDVFISHAAADKVIADDMVVALEQGGVHCWVAPRDIRPGDTWGGSIVKAIESSTIMVVIFSESSNKSRQVLREVERAVQKDVVVLPFRLDEVEPTGDMEYFLSATHWLEALGQDIQVHYQHLLRTTLSILKREAAAPQNSVDSKRAPVEQVPAPQKSLNKVNDSDETPANKQKPLFAEAPSVDISSEPSTESLPAEAAALLNSGSEDQAHSTTSEHLDKSTDHKDPPITQHRSSNAEKQSPKFDFSNDLETHSEIELANELDAAHAGLDLEKPAQLEMTGQTAMSENTEETPDKPYSHSEHEAPDLILDQSYSRLEVNNTKRTPKWPFAAVLLITVSVGGWFYFDLPSKLIQPSIPNNAAEISNSEPHPVATKPKTLQSTDSAADTPSAESLNRPPASAQMSTEQADELEKLRQQELAEQQAREKQESERRAKELAFNQLQERATAGNQNAQLTLAKMYENGEGIARNYKASTQWLTKAAQGGNSQAQYELSERFQAGKGTYQNSEEAVNWLTRAAQQNNVNAQTGLAERYSTGNGVPKDDVLALSWYLKAAEQGGLKAQKSLATIYEFGLGTNSDLIAAVKWYTAAASQGDMSSTLYLEKLLNKAPQLRELVDLEASETGIQRTPQ